MQPMEGRQQHYYRILYRTWIAHGRGGSTIPTDQEVKDWFENNFLDHLPKDPVACRLHLYQASNGMGITVKTMAAWIHKEFEVLKKAA